VEVANADAATGIAVRLVLGRRSQVRRRRVALRLVEQLEAVAVGVREPVRPAVTGVAVEPGALDSGSLQRRDTALERLRRVRAVGEMPHARLRRGGQLERRALVVAEAAQVERVSALARDLHAEKLAEVEEALLRLRREQLEVREMRDVADRLAHARYPCGSASRCAARRVASAMIVRD